jgi:hypothetical protein
LFVGYPDVYTAALREELSARGVAARVQNDFQDLLAEPLTRMQICGVGMVNNNRQ